MLKTTKSGANYNRISADRVKTVYTEQGISQGEFARIINMQQAAISEMVNGKRKVTATTAQAIHAAFPDYSVEWILGTSDYKNDTEKNIATINQIRREGSILEAGFRLMAELKGFVIISPDERMAEALDVAEAIRQFKNGYYVTNTEGKGCHLSVEEMNRLENDVCDYIEYRLNRWIEKGR